MSKLAKNPKSYAIGRSKFEPGRLDTLIRCAAEGFWRKDCCVAAGITPQTLIKWLSDASEPDAPADLVEFAQAFHDAENETKRIALDSYRKHMPHDWRAAESWLEKRFPKEFGRRSTIEVDATVSPGSARNDDLSALTIEERKTMLALQRKARGE